MKCKSSFILVFVALSCLPFLAFPQEDSTSCSSKSRIQISGLPVVAYDADQGFQFGLVGNLYHFDSTVTYPDYKHAVKIEVSRFTKGSGVNQIFYDSKYLIPGNIRLTADMSYLTEKALDFYGFNGYQAVYNPEWEVEMPISSRRV